MKEEIRVLINNPGDNIDIIFDHFSNHNIEIIEKYPYYQLILNRTPFLYCEDFTRGLNIFGINENDVLNFYNINYQSIFSLLESWIPYGWSHFFANSNELPKKLTIIHLDDHTDLMSPFIRVNDVNELKNWKNIFTGDDIDIRNPESIKKAIESGAITLGSILTLLVFSVENINIMHFKRHSKNILRYIKKDIEIDSLIVPNQNRMAINLIEFPIDENSKNNIYIRSSNINYLIENIPDDSSDVFLHIDMDFFNNRYNGSTDWQTNKKQDIDLDQQIELIKSFCQAILNYNLTNRIVHLSIGLSPSFYPSEYWYTGLLTLINELKKIKLKIIPSIDFKGL